MKKVFTFLLLLIFNYSYSQSINNDDVNQEINSLKKLLNETDNQKAKLKILEQLCGKYYNVSNGTDSLIKYSRIGVDISISSKQDSFLLLFYSFSSAAFSKRGIYEKVLETELNALIIAEKNDDHVNIANSKIEIANVYTNTKDFNSAKKYYYEALKLRNQEKINTIDDTMNWVYLYGNISEYYSKIKNYDSSIFYSKKNIVLLDNNKTHSDYLISTYANLGDYYFKKNDFKNANYYSFKSYEIALPSFKKRLIPEDLLGLTMNKISKIYLQDNRLDSAIHFSQIAYTIFESSDMFNDMIESILILIDSYIKRNDFKNAFKYSQLLNDAKDSAKNLENLIEIENLKFKENIRLEEIEKEKQRQIKIRNNAFQIIGLALFAFISFFILFYKRNNQSKYLKYFKNIIVLLVLSIISFLIGPVLNSITNDTPIYVISFSICSSLVFSPLENKIRAISIFK